MTTMADGLKIEIKSGAELLAMDESALHAYARDLRSQKERVESWRHGGGHRSGLVPDQHPDFSGERYSAEQAALLDERRTSIRALEREQLRVTRLRGIPCTAEWTAEEAEIAESRPLAPGYRR